MKYLSVDASRTSARARAIARALRQEARKLRNAGPVATARGNTVVVQRRWQNGFRRLVVWSFLLLFVIPVCAAALYFGLIASDRYVATTQFTVRSGQQSADVLGLSVLDMEPGQNTNIIVNYIGSNDMISALQKKFDLLAIYANPAADFLSRADRDAPIERFNRYWNSFVTAKVDGASNIVTVSVEAFTPQDALRVAQGVLAQSELLVNQMSGRAQQNALRQSLSILNQAQAELSARTRELRILRDRTGIIDPGVTSNVAAQTLGELRTTLSDLEVNYNTSLQWVRPDAPQMKIQSRRIADVRAEIAKAESQIGTTAQPDGTTLAASTNEFYKANLDLDVARQHYVAAVANVERARNGIEEQSFYVLPFEQPTLPEKALYPRRFLMVLSIAGICLTLWAALVGAATLARNNLAF